MWLFFQSYSWRSARADRLGVGLERSCLVPQTRRTQTSSDRQRSGEFGHQRVQQNNRLRRSRHVQYLLFISEERK